MRRLIGAQRSHAEDACRVKLEVDEVVELWSLDFRFDFLHGEDLDLGCGLGRDIVGVDTAEWEDVSVTVLDCDSRVVGGCLLGTLDHKVTVGNHLQDGCAGASDAVSATAGGESESTTGIHTHEPVRFIPESSRLIPLVIVLCRHSIGYGISYTLPVIVALLSATPNSLIIIENPEAHLHPAGQAELAKLITLVASNGVQVFIETHSDHIISGIQLACKAYEKDNTMGISRDDVALYYFKNDSNNRLHIEPVKILETGILDYQPKGFFDQAENDMFQLYRDN